MEKIFLIFSDSRDDECSFTGFCTTEEEAKEYCEKHNASAKHSYNEVEYIEINRL